MSGQECTAEVRHAHGRSRCDLPAGHYGMHSTWCESCLEDGRDDWTDRLEWVRDGEDLGEPDTESPVFRIVFVNGPAAGGWADVPFPKREQPEDVAVPIPMDFEPGEVETLAPHSAYYSPERDPYMPTRSEDGAYRYGFARYNIPWGPL